MKKVLILLVLAAIGVVVAKLVKDRLDQPSYDSLDTGPSTYTPTSPSPDPVPDPSAEGIDETPGESSN